MKHRQPENFEDAARLLSARRNDTLDYFVRHGVLARSSREFAYRDHRFLVRSFGSGWRVFIHTPGSGILFKDVPRSFKPESRDAVIQEAKIGRRSTHSRESPILRGSRNAAKEERRLVDAVEDANKRGDLTSLLGQLRSPTRHLLLKRPSPDTSIAPAISSVSKSV